jgi:hypothetical protein
VVAGEPKFRPVVVTDAPPLRGPFRKALLTTGPSKENPSWLNVPTTLFTVSCNLLAMAMVLWSIPQYTEVAVLQLDVRHADPSEPVVGV